MNCVKNAPDTNVPLGQLRIARYLCEDAMRGSGCPHHERIAKRLYEIVTRAQAEEKLKWEQEALDRIVENLKNATHSV